MQFTLPFLMAAIAASVSATPAAPAARGKVVARSFGSAGEGYASDPSDGYAGSSADPSMAYPIGSQGFGGLPNYQAGGPESSIYQLNDPRYRAGRVHGGSFAQPIGYGQICQGYNSLQPIYDNCHSYLESPSCDRQGAFDHLSRFADEYSGVVNRFQRCDQCGSQSGPEFDAYRDAVGGVGRHFQGIAYAMHRRFPSAQDQQFFAPVFRRFQSLLSIVINLALSLHVDVQLLFLNLNIDLKLLLNIQVDVLGLIHIGIGGSSHSALHGLLPGLL